MRLILASGLAVALVLGYVGVTKAAKPVVQALTKAEAPPALSTEHKLQFQVILQRLEIAKLHYEAAQQDFAAAQRDAAALVEQTKVPGYDLDLTTFNYSPLPAGKK
jgi:hypothetical protein